MTNLFNMYTNFVNHLLDIDGYVIVARKEIILLCGYFSSYKYEVPIIEVKFQPSDHKIRSLTTRSNYAKVKSFKLKKIQINGSF